MTIGVSHFLDSIGSKRQSRADASITLRLLRLSFRSPESSLSRFTPYVIPPPKKKHVTLQLVTPKDENTGCTIQVAKIGQLLKMDATYIRLVVPKQK